MSKLYIDEDGKTSIYEILEDEVTIGRGAASAVQLRDRRASKHHALIRRVKARWKFIDLESKNGTRVNGVFANQHWIQQGDTLTVGMAVIRIDLEGAGVAPPPSAVPTPAVVSPPPVPVPPPVPPPVPQPVPPPVPAVPAPRSAPRSAAPAAPQARSASPRPGPHRTRPGRAAVGSRSGRDVREEEYYEDDEGTRPVRKRRVDSGVIVLIGGLAAVAFVVLMFSVMGSSLSDNKEVWLRANEIASPPANDYAEAIRYAEQHCDPGGEDWERLREDIQNWKKLLAGTQKRLLDEEADKWLNENITKRTNTTGFRPVNPLRNEEVATLLRQFLQKYAGTRAASWILGTRQGEPWETFQHILRTYASANVDVGQILAAAKADADALVRGKRYGEAIRIYENLEKTQRLLIDGDLYATLVSETQERQKELLRDAGESFHRELREIRAIARKGERRRARAKLQVMMDTWGIPDLTREGEEEMERLK